MRTRPPSCRHSEPLSRSPDPAHAATGTSRIAPHCLLGRH
jgi:hypothetical protein